jgi:hypothetical protein
MPFILDSNHHIDTKTTTDIMVGGVVACIQDVWEHLWPPEAGKANHGKVVSVDQDDIIEFRDMGVAIASDQIPRTPLNSVFGGSIVPKEIKINNGQDVLYKIALDGDIPGGTAGNPAPMQKGYYGTDSEGKKKWIDIGQFMVPPHPLLKKVDDGGKHMDTITHTPPANGDIIKGLSDKWDVLALGTGYLTFDPEGGTNGVNWRDLGTDPQDLIVYNAGAYSLKNDAASPPADSFYGAIVSGGTANIGWHTKTVEDKTCGGGGGSGDTQCCPTGLSVRRVKVTESGPIKVELTLSFSKPLKKAGDNADVSLSGTATHSSDTQNWNSTEATINGTSIDFTITLPGSWADGVETEIKVTKISDGVLCTSGGKDFVVSKMLNTNTACHTSVKVKLGDTIGRDGDPTGQPCNSTPMVTSIRVTITNGHTVGVEVSLSGMGFLKVDITSINGDDRAFVDGVIEHFPPNAARCTTGGVGAAGGPETNVARAIQKGKPNTVCLMIWVGCCSDTFNNTKWVKTERCFTVNVDENGNGETTVNIPLPPNEPPPPAPTGNCDPKPTLACSKISFDNGTLMGFFEASRLVTGVARGTFTVSDGNGNVLFQGETATLIFSNQQASKNVIAVADRMIPLENNKTYNICVTAGQLACWDNPQVLADPATCCAPITPVNGRGDGVPGGGGGGDGNGGNIPPGGGEKCIPNFDPGGGPTLAGGCANVFLNGSRRFVVYNAMGQHAIAVVIPTTYQTPNSFDNLPDGIKGTLTGSTIRAISAADVRIVNGKAYAFGGGALNPKIGEPNGASGQTYYHHEYPLGVFMSSLWSTISPLANLQPLGAGNNPPGIGINLPQVPGQPQQIQGLNSGTGVFPITFSQKYNTNTDVDVRPKGNSNDKPTSALAYPRLFADIIVGALGLVSHTDTTADMSQFFFPLSSYLYPHSTYTRNKQVVSWWVLPGAISKDAWTYVQENGGIANWGMSISFKLCIYYM